MRPRTRDAVSGTRFQIGSSTRRTSSVVISFTRSLPMVGNA